MQIKRDGGFHLIAAIFHIPLGHSWKVTMRFFREAGGWGGGKWAIFVGWRGVMGGFLDGWVCEARKMGGMVKNAWRGRVDLRGMVCRCMNLFVILVRNIIIFLSYV